MGEARRRPAAPPRRRARRGRSGGAAPPAPRPDRCGRRARSARAVALPRDGPTGAITSWIPDIDANFRTLADQPHRAMAGLSMGGADNAIRWSISSFPWVGLFSGGTVGDPATAHNGVMANATEFNKKMKLIFQSCGSKERPEGVKASYDQLKAAGINTAMYVSEGTAHEWQTWRQNLREFALLAFRN